MPVKRRRHMVRRPEIEVPDLDLERTLLFGSPFFGWPADEIFEAAWELHRRTVLDWWFEGGRFGMRPYGMWACELVPKFGERKVIDERYLPGGKYHHYLTHLPHRGKILHEHGIPPLQEAEHVYLRRHNLLTPDERKMDPAELDRLQTCWFDQERIWGDIDER